MGGTASGHWDLTPRQRVALALLQQVRRIDEYASGDPVAPVPLLDLSDSGEVVDHRSLTEELDWHSIMRVILRSRTRVVAFSHAREL